MKSSNSSFSLLAHLPISERRFIQFLKLIVSLGAFIYIVCRLYTERTYFDQWLSELYGNQISFVIATLLLIPLNWGLEAERWRKMMKPVYQRLSVFNSLKAILAGIATGMFTPNRVGEYIGRMWMIPQNKRVEAVTYTFLNRIYQMQITLLMGTLAFEYVHIFEKAVLLNLFPDISIFWIRYFLWGINLVIWISVIFPQWLDHCFLRFLPDFPWVANARKAIHLVKVRTLIYVIGLGILRYLVFSLQFYFLMLAFGYTSGMGLGMAMIGLIFLIKSIIPFVAVAELGIRESVAITVMTLFMQSSFIAFSSTFILYLCNIILPALVGLIILNQKSPK